MKKIFLISIAMIGLFATINPISAKERTKIGDGIYLVKYGNVAYGIENDNTQQCVNLSVKQEKKNDGSVVYNILCGNKYTKGITKVALGTTIGTALSGAGQTWLTPFVISVANNIYDDVCDYYGEKK